MLLLDSKCLSLLWNNRFVWFNLLLIRMVTFSFDICDTPIELWVLHRLIIIFDTKKTRNLSKSLNSLWLCWNYWNTYCSTEYIWVSFKIRHIWVNSFFNREETFLCGLCEIIIHVSPVHSGVYLVYNYMD